MSVIWAVKDNAGRRKPAWDAILNSWIEAEEFLHPVDEFIVANFPNIRVHKRDNGLFVTHLEFENKEEFLWFLLKNS